MLEQTPALGRLATVVADRAPDVVDHAECGAPDDRRVVHVVGEPLGELLALPHTVDPVRVAAVAAADVNRYGKLGLHIETQWRTGGIGRSMVAPVGMRVPDR